MVGRRGRALASMGFVPWRQLVRGSSSRTAAARPGPDVRRPDPRQRQDRGGLHGAVQTGLTGKTHMDVRTSRSMRAMPGMTVLAPGDATEMRRDDPLGDARPPGPSTCAWAARPARRVRAGLRLRARARDPAPRGARRSCSSPPASRRPGRSRRPSSSGEDGISAGVLHVPSIKPVDEAAIAAAARRRPARRDGGGAHGHRRPGRSGGGDRDRPRPAAADPHRDRGHLGRSAPNAWLLERHGLTPERVAERVRRAWSRG